MTIEEQKAYLLLTYRKAPEGSARRIWAAAQLAQLGQAPQPQPDPKPTGGKREARRGR